MIDNNSLFPIILSTIAGLSTVLGAVLIFFTKTKNDRFLTFSLGFSAGVMITVSFTDLFPTAEASLIKYLGKNNGLLWSILFLLIGALMAYLIDSFIPSEEKGKFPKTNNNFELFRIGLVSTIALMIHNFPEGIAIAMPIYFATKSRYKAIKYSFLSGMTEPLGAFLSFLFLKPFINELILGIIFAIVCGIMLYISFNELVPSSWKYRHPRLALSSLFLGICIMPITHLFI